MSSNGKGKNGDRTAKPDPEDPQHATKCERCPVGRLAGVGKAGFCPLIPRKYAAGDVIFTRGRPANYLWFVKEGRIEIRDGRNLSRGPGSLIGLDSLSGDHYAETAVASEDTVLCGATKDGFVEFLERDKS